MEDDPPAGVPEWVVTYGDMMSLLLTFFIMLVSLSEVVAEGKYRAVLDAIHQYIGYHNAPLAPAGKNFPLNSIIERMQTLGAFTDTKRSFGGIKTPAPPGPDIHVLRKAEGAPQQAGRSILFAADDATLSADAQTQLVEIATILAGKPNKIEILARAAPPAQETTEGYDRQLVLSYQRARAVWLFLVKQSVARERLRLTAFADSPPQPRAGNRETVHTDRVEVLILDEFAGT